MTGRKGGLSKGLGDILNAHGKDVLERPALEVLKEIDLNRIQAGRYQPRTIFDEQSLSELAQSIAEHGVLQPLVVRPIGGEHYEIIAGERRFRASQRLGLLKLPCIVKNYDDRQALAVALIENLQRTDLNALEEAEGLQKLVEEFQLTHERVAQLIGRSRSSISNSLRLLELGDEVKKALRTGNIEMGHARALHSLNLMEQNALLADVIRKKMSVRQTEVKVREMRNCKIDVTKNPIKTADIEDLEEKISSFLGFGITINHRKKGNGKIVLKYDNLNELEAIFEKWGYR